MEKKKSTAVSLTTSKRSSEGVLEAISRSKPYLALVPATVKQAVESKHQVSGLAARRPDIVRIVIAKLLSDTVVMFDTDMSKQAVHMTVESIIKMYWFLKIDEIAYILQKAASGQFKIYGKLTPQMIMEWFHLYDTGERSEFIADIGAGFSESRGDYFTEQENKKAQRLNKEIERMSEKFVAAKHAKIKVDGYSEKRKTE